MAELTLASLWWVNRIGSRMALCFLLTQKSPRTGKTLLTAIRDGEVEHWGLTPPIVPGLFGA